MSADAVSELEALAARDDRPIGDIPPSMPSTQKAAAYMDLLLAKSGEAAMCGEPLGATRTGW